MKRLTVYLFLTVYLLSFTEVQQILRLPNLVSHFLAHRISNSDTTVYSFLKMHYVDEQSVDSDYEQDMKLPFKTHETNTVVVNPLTIPEDFTFSLLSPAPFRERKVIPFEISFMLPIR